MRNFYGNSGATRRANDWREMLDELQAGREHLRVYGDQMSPYERGLIEREIKSREEQYRQAVAGGVLGEYESSIKGYQDAESKFDKERAKEISRWTVSELRDAIQLTREMVNDALSAGRGDPLTRSPGAGERLKAIYSEAVASGDPVRQRACFEIFQLVQPEGDVEINHLVEQSKKDLKAIRTTPEVVAAAENVSKAWSNLETKRGELRQVAQVLGEPDPGGPFASGEFGKAFKRVQIERESGKVKIFSPDAPEATGVDFSKLETFGG